MKKCLSIFLFVCAFPVWAADWIVVAATDDLSVYVDRHSVMHSGRFLTAEIAYSFREGQQIAGRTYKSAKAVFLYACAEKKSGAYQSAFYAESRVGGTPIHSWSVAPASVVLSQVDQDSIKELINNAVCRFW
jgi:hypothetical protein